VKVFILMGQSNIVGMGDIGPETNKGTLTYLEVGLRLGWAMAELLK
jgi:hypothetical protein